jgi:hypothetical protein
MDALVDWESQLFPTVETKATTRGIFVSFAAI